MTYKLSGSIRVIHRLEAKLTICGFGDNLPEYTGPYEITPRVTEQILDTADKKMSTDLKILSIPIQEITNSSNGKTIYIG